VAAENRLTVEQLAGLSPGDAVTIESGQDFGRRRHASGTVVRIEGSRVVVSCKGPRGATFIEHYGRRDGLRVGRGQRAELVNPDGMGAVSTERRRQVLRIDALFREWTANRADTDRLRQLRAAIDECLQDSASLT
jgi:hypothetical protein